ncbi:MAG: SRPBCC domain-containing protein [Steroidobacteraceae bacterium]
MKQDASRIPGDQVEVSVTVPVGPAVAFDLFTRETDLWWRRGVRFRAAGRAPGALHFEPGVGGRLFEEYSNDAGVHLVEFGRVTAWEPPARLVFEWRNVNFAPDEKTEVDVSFEAIHGGTRITLIHRGWASLRADHPARHGMAVAAFIRTMGLWWGDLLSALREHAAGS